MAGLNWTASAVSPQDILDAMANITPSPLQFSTRFTASWESPQTYLQWAQDCLVRGDAFGWDAAVCFAKRAVGRQIDGLLVRNHLQRSLFATYPKKMEVLKVLDYDLPDVVHELIIEPRNESEHDYRPCNARQAKHAYEIAKLFLRDIDPEDELTIISYGLDEDLSKILVGEMTEVRKAVIDNLSTASGLLVDFTNPADHIALILRPKDQELLTCSMTAFKTSDLIAFARFFRTIPNFEVLSSISFEAPVLQKLKTRLNLP